MCEKIEVSLEKTGKEPAQHSFPQGFRMNSVAYIKIIDNCETMI